MNSYPNPNNERGLRHTAAAVGGHTYGESPASGPAPTTAGHHTHDLLNKLDPRIDSTHDKQPMPASGNGPHSSRVANILDPRVDSKTGIDKRTGAANPSVMHGGGSGVPEGTYGPHSSRLANTVDPRVDSDMDSRRTAGVAPGYGSNTAPGYGDTYGQTNTGHGQATGYGQAGNAGYYTQPNAGVAHHGVGHNQATAMSGPGPATHTAGPHSSNLLNKLDPRVDNVTGQMKSQEPRRGL